MYTKIPLPEKPKLVFEAGNAATYEIEGLYPGYGVTVGNAIRRSLLSSIPGAAITRFSIDGVLHEFSAMEGVLEDVLQIRLNLKQVRIKMLVDEPQELTINVKGVKEVTAKDIEAPSTCEVVNPEQKIATLTKKDAALNMKLTVERGIGFALAEHLKKEKAPEGVVPVDALFSPVKKVMVKVEDMRVGDRADFNKLRVDIETDGTISPHDAMNAATQTLIDQFGGLLLE